MFCKIIKKLGFCKGKQPDFPCCETLELQPRMEKGIYCYEGDSNVHAFNVKDWLGEKWYNQGIGGSTSTDVLQRAWMDKRHPSKIVIQIGGNDILRGVDIETAISNLKKTITQYKTYGTRVYITGLCPVNKRLKHPLTGVPYPYYFSIWNDRWRELAKEMRISFFDIFIPLTLLYNKNKSIDYIHYGNRGRAIVAKIIKSVIR